MPPDDITMTFTVNDIGYMTAMRRLNEAFGHLGQQAAVAGEAFAEFGRTLGGIPIVTSPFVPRGEAYLLSVCREADPGGWKVPVHIGSVAPAPLPVRAIRIREDE